VQRVLTGTIVCTHNRLPLIVTWLDNLAVSCPDASGQEKERKVSKSNGASLERALRRIITALLLPSLRKHVLDVPIVLLALWVRSFWNVTPQCRQHLWNDTQLHHLNNFYKSEPKQRRLIARLLQRGPSGTRMDLLHNSHMRIWPLFMLDRACALIKPVSCLIAHHLSQLLDAKESAAKMSDAAIQASLNMIARISEQRVHEIRDLLKC